MTAGIYSKVEVRTLGHNPHVVIILGPIIMIHIPDIFSPLGKKVLVDCTTLQFSHSDSCPNPAT